MNVKCLCKQHHRQLANAFLTELLPYDLSIKKHTQLMTGLKEYRFLITAFLEALKFFTARTFEKFDSLVGENACHIRAVWLAEIGLKGLRADELLRNLMQCSKKIEELLSSETMHILMRKEISLKELLEEENLDIALTFDESFLIQSYLLAETKVEIQSTTHIASLCHRKIADPKKIRRFGDVSVNFAARLMSRLRKLLSNASVQNAREWASASQDKLLMKMVSDCFLVKHNDCLCIPMFWSCKSVLFAALKNRIPLIVHAQFLDRENDGFKILGEQHLIFNASAGELRYEEGALEDEEPALIFQGVVCPNTNGPLSALEWKARMSQYSIVDAILAGAADHRQYHDPSKERELFELKEREFETYRTIAKEEGFSLENPTTFFIRHVYAGSGPNGVNLSSIS